MEDTRWKMLDRLFGVRSRILDLVNGNEQEEDYRAGNGMVIYAEGNYEAREHSGRNSWETLQFQGVHNALHVSLEIKTLRITQLSMDLHKSQKEILLQLNAFDGLGEKASFSGLECAKTMKEMAWQLYKGKTIPGGRAFLYNSKCEEFLGNF